MAAPLPMLCVVAPCYNEAEVIELFHQALKPVLLALPDLRHCIFFVDDGSDDGTLDKLNALAARDACVRVCSLSRHFGHQIALTAGLDAAQGDAVLMMDCDLQHPPSLIPEMVKRWRAGYEVVSTLRLSNAGSSWPRSVCSNAFYWLLGRLTGTPIVTRAADFCLLSHRAHQALRQMPERHRFLRGMVGWIGFRRAMVPFSAPGRPAGRSKYSWSRMSSLAADALFSFSAAPLRLASRAGLLAISLSLLYLGFILVCLVQGQPIVPGWTSIVFLITFFGGVQLASIGLLGEYVARIFEEVKSRPLYLFKQPPASEGFVPSSPPRHGDCSGAAGTLPVL